MYQFPTNYDICESCTYRAEFTLGEKHYCTSCYADIQFERMQERLFDEAFPDELAKQEQESMDKYEKETN